MQRPLLQRSGSAANTSGKSGFHVLALVSSGLSCVTQSRGSVCRLHTLQRASTPRAAHWLLGRTGAPDSAILFGAALFALILPVAVLRNPFAGVEQGDLTELFEYGASLGAQLAAEAMVALDALPVSYGKAAIVGAFGTAERGAALLYTRLGKPVRAAIGGGQALLPSTVKLGGLGCFIDLPLGHKDEAWSFDHIDTLSIAVSDAPCPNEIVVCVSISDGARIRAPAGKGPGR